MQHKRIFSTPDYQYFADALCHSSGCQRGKLTRNRFPDGEKYYQFNESVQGCHAVLVGGSFSDNATLELFDLACGLVHHGVEMLTMLMPYFGYSTMERASNPGEIVMAKSRAQLFSAIPIARTCNEIALLDLHTDGISYYFEGQIRPYHLQGHQLVADAIRSQFDLSECVIASTDAGRAKWVEYLANQLETPAAFVYKRRSSGSATEIRGINADVNGKHVIIYDDMIRTGGSLLKAAQAYHENGAAKVTAVSTHGVLPETALKRIKQSSLLQKVIVTDSHPNAVKLQKDFDPEWFQVISCVEVFSRFLCQDKA